MSDWTAPKRKSYTLFGSEVCLQALTSITGTSFNKIKRMEDAIIAGSCQPWEDQRRYNGSSLSSLSKEHDADSFFSFAYHYLTDTMSTPGPVCVELQSRGHAELIAEWIQARDGNPLAGASAGIGSSIDRRYLSHIQLSDLFEMYQAHHVCDFDSDLGAEALTRAKAKRDCFDNTYWKNWSDLLLFKNSGHHDRCEKCADFCKQRREHPDPEERAKAHRGFQQHMQQMIDDRRVDCRLTRLSEMSCSDEAATSEGLLHVRIDGMDQAKFRCPRNMESSKKWAGLWRPTLHMVGVLIEGVLEMYFVMDADVPKDSNCECTCLSLALDEASKILAERGLNMPKYVSLKYDNTGREGKNQHVAKFEAFLQAKGHFIGVQDGNSEKGHTHDGLDQRYAVATATMGDKKLIEEPHGFCEVLEKDMQPVRGRVVRARYLEATWDWQSFFRPLEVSYTGIAASHTKPDVCHSKRFVARSEIATVAEWSGLQIETPAPFVCYEPDNRDVIMLCKQFWSSDQLAQNPIVALPYKLFETLERGPTKRLPRNTLSETSVAQFLKTAKAVTEEPWHMDRAGHYLEKFVARNQGLLPMPPLPELGFVAMPAKEKSPIIQKPPHDVWTKYAPRPPAKIEITQAKPQPKKRDAGMAIWHLPVPADAILPPPILTDDLAEVPKEVMPRPLPKKRGRPPKLQTVGSEPAKAKAKTKSRAVPAPGAADAPAAVEDPAPDAADAPVPDPGAVAAREAPEAAPAALAAVAAPAVATVPKASVAAVPKAPVAAVSKAPVAAVPKAPAAPGAAPKTGGVPKHAPPVPKGGPAAPKAAAAKAAAAKAAAGPTPPTYAADLPRALGCSKCRYSYRGCAKCKV